MYACVCYIYVLSLVYIYMYIHRLQVEYVVRTQLGFSFDSLKTLHFITTFGAALAACLTALI